MSLYTKDNLTRIKNDVNGNPRYVIQYLALLTEEDKADNSLGAIRNRYNLAVAKARKLIGGRKYHTKNYGGGIVFQSYNVEVELALINALHCDNKEALSNVS